MVVKARLYINMYLKSFEWKLSRTTWEDTNPIEINNLSDEKRLQEEEIQKDVPKGVIRKGQVIRQQQPFKLDEICEKAESLQKYIEDMKTTVPATINQHGEQSEGKFLHFDSSVAKIDALYHSILTGHSNANQKRQRRDGTVAKGDTTVHQHESKAVTELQLTVLGMDQEWNMEVLKAAYESKTIGIRVYSNALDLIRRSMSIREAQFQLLIQRYVKYRKFDGVETMLLINDDNVIDNDVVFDVLNRIPQICAQHTAKYQEKVAKLIRLNTLILTEQVRVFQQIRESDLVLRLRWPYPITDKQTTKHYVDMLMPKRSLIKKHKKRSNLVKVEFPAPMDDVLRTSRFLNKNSSSDLLWRNPSRQTSNAQCVTEPMPHILMLDCNTLKSHHDVALPMAPAKNKKSLNIHKTIPPIITSRKSTEKDPSSFTLPLVCTYSTTDSGYDGSNVILDPARYM